jgi:TPR repeat protein
MNALSIFFLSVLLLTFAGCGEVVADKKTEAAASAVPAVLVKELTPEEEFAVTKRKAEAGDAEAQFKLGKIYANDGFYFDASGVLIAPIIAKDAAKAVEWYRKAAAQGHAEAQYHLGWKYSKGEGVPKDAAKAAEWYRKAAAQGHAEAQYHLGNMYYEGLGISQDYAEAVKWWLLAAAQGHAIRPTTNVFDQFDEARGHAMAQYHLGYMYFSGKGVAQNYIEAVKWYRLAAAQGSAGAQFNLGGMYGNGQGVAQDYVRAHLWLNLSAASGDASHLKNRDLVASKMTSQQIAQAQKMASDCQQKKFKGCD